MDETNLKLSSFSTFSFHTNFQHMANRCWLDFRLMDFKILKWNGKVTYTNENILRLLDIKIICKIKHKIKMNDFQLEPKLWPCPRDVQESNLIAISSYWVYMEFGGLKYGGFSWRLYDHPHSLVSLLLFSCQLSALHCTGLAPLNTSCNEPQSHKSHIWASSNSQGCVRMKKYINVSLSFL